MADLRGLAETVLLDELDAVAVVRLCPKCGSHEHGRPLVQVRSGRAPEVSIAYAGELAAVAWSWTGPVGIDIEPAGPPIEGVGDRQAWTRVEALLKATGTGLARDPSDLPALPTTRLSLPAGWVGTVAGEDVSWRLAGPAAPARRASR